LEIKLSFKINEPKPPLGGQNQSKQALGGQNAPKHGQVPGFFEKCKIPHSFADHFWAKNRFFKGPEKAGPRTC
jgi:hypothetical protein